MRHITITNVPGMRHHAFLPTITARFEGLEDVEATGIRDYLVEPSTIVSTDPPVIRVAVRHRDGAIGSIEELSMHAEHERSHAESLRAAEALARSWFVQELTFSHYEKAGWLTRRAVYRATRRCDLRPVDDDVRYVLAVVVPRVPAAA